MNDSKDKKKSLIFFTFIICFIIVIVSFMFQNRAERVEKFSTVKIMDCYRNEIDTYSENKMPFTIVKNSENVKVFVNGIEYKDNKRFYETGEYQIIVDDGNKKEKATICIKNIERKAESEYHMYMTSGTLSTLFANLDMGEKENINGFFWTQRTGMMNLNNFANNLPNLKISENIGETEENEIRNKVIPEMSNYVRKVLKNDENAYFHLYIDEYRFYMELELFGKIGLSDERYDVTICTDGTLSYVRDYEITNDGEFENFLKQKKEYEELVEKMRDDTLEYNSVPGTYLKGNKDDYNYNYLLISTLRKNIKYVLQYPEMLVFNDERIAEEMQNANFKKIIAQDEFNKLSEGRKEMFFENINLDKANLDKEYFNDADSKYLVITGTKPYYGIITQEKFEDLIKRVYNDYQNEYKILFKPHPTALPNDEQRKFLEDLGIKILPGTIPMEAITFIYPNLKLGGFDSSLYMSVDSGKTEFFFAEDKEQLVEPLNQLYDRLFSGVKFYN